MALARMYVCMHECMPVCTCICMYAHTHARMYVCMYTCMYVHTYMHRSLEPSQNRMVPRRQRPPETHEYYKDFLELIAPEQKGL
jgi:hypothetical protein